MAAQSLVGHLANGCWEEGVLMAQLWNLHTTLMDAGLQVSRVFPEVFWNNSYV